MNHTVTEFEVIRWDSPEELASLLTLRAAEDWRGVGLTRLKGEGDAGWTILSRYRSLNPSLLDYEVKASEIYAAMNKTEAYENPAKALELIKEAIKYAYARDYPDAERLSRG